MRERERDLREGVKRVERYQRVSERERERERERDGREICEREGFVYKETERDEKES